MNRFADLVRDNHPRNPATGDPAMITAHQGRSYAMKTSRVDGKPRTDFAMVCAGCGAEEAIHMEPDTPPDIVVSKFKRRGWAANERNPGGCYCPACLKPKEKPTMAVQAELPKGPSHEQLKRVAEHLRGCFEPEAGHYLDGATDHTVADKLGIPWGWVKQVRELLGFDIRVDPEIKAMRDELAALAEMVMALDKKLSFLERKRVAS